jgi:hypothetical protein
MYTSYYWIFDIEIRVTIERIVVDIFKHTQKETIKVESVWLKLSLYPRKPTRNTNLNIDGEEFS